MSLLRERMIEDMQLHGLSANTQDVYVRAVCQLSDYVNTVLAKITEEDLRRYFLYLAKEKKCSRSTSTIALCGIKFFFERTLGRDWPILDLVRPGKERKLPVVLSRQEVHQVLSCPPLSSPTDWRRCASRSVRLPIPICSSTPQRPAICSAPRADWLTSSMSPQRSSRCRGARSTLLCP